MLIATAVLAACSSLNNTPNRAGADDPRPAYHLVSVSKEGVTAHNSHDGIHWRSIRNNRLPITDCYDLALSPDGSQQFLAYNHRERDGRHTLNILQSVRGNKWPDKPSRVFIPTTTSCGQPQMRHLHDDLYGVLWLDKGTLYSAIYDAGARSGKNLTLSKPIHNEWLTLLDIYELSFAYHKGSVYVVWSPNSNDRIMTMQGNINDNIIDYGQPDYHLEDHLNISNMITDGELMYIVVVTGDRVNMLMSSDDGSYWDNGPICYNTENIPLYIPFLYKNTTGEKVYLRTNDYSGRVKYLQNFPDCEDMDIKLPSETLRIEYFPGRQ